MIQSRTVATFSFKLFKMEKKVVFCLLILCGVLSRGICTSSEETENSSDLHIRKKRIIGTKIDMAEAPFLVSLIANGQNYCPATLITNAIAITSAECFKAPSPRGWHIQTRSSYFHQVTKVIPYGQYNSSHPTVNNLALAFFHPPINHHIVHNRPIQIYNGNLGAEQENPLAFNWNHRIVAGQRQQSSTDLEKVILQFISYEYCRNKYPGTVITGTICTQSWKANYECQHMDTGAPLVIRNQLIGIFALRKQNCRTDPDVFMNLLDHGIRHWIQEHVPALRLF